MCYIYNAFVVAIILFCNICAYADGSKDFYPRYPEQVRGNRAFLVSRAQNSTNVFFNQAAHYVYVRENEVLAVASSAQGIKNGFIQLTSPSGKVVQTIIGSTSGKIASRAEEVAGPGLGYTPFEINVGDDIGVWRVEFIPTRWSNNRLLENSDKDLVVRADDDWIQPDNSYYIAAWDVSVRKAGNTITEWLPGRVFTNVLHLYISSATLNQEEGAFFGQNYVLTKDGYIYKVDGNGSHGIDFQYFVNSSGILDADHNPSYKSSNDGFKALFHDPNKQDVSGNVTHKMFYRFPDVTMPKNSPAASPLIETWLYNEIKIAQISNVEFETIEGNKNYVNKKGAEIRFVTNYAGRYRVTIESASEDFLFKQKEIIVSGVVGKNSLIWDGTDGDGSFIPVGSDYPIKVSVSLIEGEIHFPYFDMEINPRGILVERYNPDGTSAGYASMYWDDTAITSGALGESSSPVLKLDDMLQSQNGQHSWGTYRQSDLPAHVASNYGGNDNYGAYSYGNNKAMDTWSYSVRMNESIEPQITVLMIDLEVVSLDADKDKVELGETFSHTVEVRNNGPSDAVNAKFEYALPIGFVITGVSPQSSCGTLSNQVLLDNTAVGRIDLPAGCRMTIVVSARSEITVPDASYGIVKATAGLVRPEGYYDIDATSDDRTRLVPGTAEEECLSGKCNNIKVNDKVFLLEPFNERGQLALVKSVKHIDKNGNGFQEADELLEYTFTIFNTGEVDVSSIYIEDPLLDSQKIKFDNLILKKGEKEVRSHTYSIQGKDVLRGEVVNTARVYGLNPRKFIVTDISGTADENDIATRIDIDQSPRLGLKASVINIGSGENGQFTIGDRIDYLLEVKHEGSIAVGKILIQDFALGWSESALATEYFSNKILSYLFSYVVNEGDIERGYVKQSSLIEGKDEKYGNRIIDNSGETFTDDLPLITKTAIAPRGVDDNFTLYQGKDAVFAVLENDLLGSSSLMTIKLEIVDSPEFGTVSVDNGLVRYVPNHASIYGKDSFTYRVMDNSKLKSNLVRVNIDIVKTIPVAKDDFYVMTYNFFTDIIPSKNDYVEHSSIVKGSVQILESPQKGLLSPIGEGVFRYKPQDNYTGYDKFTYIIQDENGNWSAPATVNLEVKGFFLPNTITPNGDQKNETFEILGAYLFDKIELEIVDRFGRVVFHSRDYHNDWNVDSKVKDGTYFYTFKGIKSGVEPIIRKGSLLIVRALR